MRCFIAIDLPEHVKAKIFHEFERLKQKNLFVGNFTDKDNFHLTLKFLGELSPEQIKNILEKLKEIKFQKFDCKINNIGFFDSEKNIKIIWVDLISNEINNLYKEISKKIPEIKEDKEFTSHITIARVKSVHNQQALLNEVGKINLKKLDFEANEFCLMKSELMKNGPKYKIIEKFPLN